MAYKDPEKQKEYHRDWVRNKCHSDPEYRKRRNAASAKSHSAYFERARVVIADFRKKGCRLCKEKNHDSLCAHHRNPKTKRFGIGDIFRIKPNLKKLAAELKKCDCLCLNCHAKLHARLRREDGRP